MESLRGAFWSQPAGTIGLVGPGVPREQELTSRMDDESRMRLIIEHSKSKREIVGPFNIAASRHDFEELVRQISERLADPAWSYGWVNVYEKRTQGFTDTGRKPAAWDDASG